MFLAVTGKGVCALHFIGEGESESSMRRVRSEWPGAEVLIDQGFTAKYAERVFNTGGRTRPLNLLVSGTNFQVRVWRALLELPAGELTTYSSIARRIDNPGASRAVGTAVGANPVSWLIPCHRVIRATGVSGSYRWGESRKRLMNAWESIHTQGAESASTARAQVHAG
jgi:AraC family transcriptional regulator of adaptative response/methylated-DNA-[protein]-cysteine methyltransferase